MKASIRTLRLLFTLGGIFCAHPVGASTAIVPDDAPTVQSAIDTGADTVLIRGGLYNETPQAYRGVTILALGDHRPILAGLAISNPFEWLSRRWSVNGIDFTGPVTITTANVRARLIAVSLSNCTLSGGVQHDLSTSTDPYDIDGIAITQCRLGSSIVVQAAQVSMEADTVDGGVKLYLEEAMSIRSCWFRGGSGTALDVDGSSSSGLIENTVFESYENGIVFTNSYGLTIRANKIMRMSGFGMKLGGEGGLISENLVADCRTGLSTDFFDTTLLGNTFLRIGSTGLWFDQPFRLRAERNIIGRCGGHGLAIEFGDGGDFQLRQNTIFSNTGSGIAILYANGNSVLAQQNVLFGNAGWGLDVGEPQSSVVLGCNDWFGNVEGIVRGGTLEATDLSADPGFCDAATDSVSLYSDSPLLAHGTCGQIGARGVGCAPPALKALEVVSGRGGLEVTWEFDASSLVESWVERAEDVGGSWDSLATGGSAGTNSFELLDRAVVPDRAYNYRVAWKDRGTIVRGSPVSGSWTDAGRLSSVSPNPARGLITVDWVLARPGLTDIRVFDLAGREVSIVARGTFDVGRHQARWDGRWEGRGIAPAGMYIVRISSGERTTSHRILLLR